MQHETGTSDPLLSSLNSIWEKRNYDLDFYFSKIFDRVLTSLKSRLEASTIKLMADDEPIYKSMFVPVGFSPENIALISVLFSPLHLTLAFSEISKAYYNKGISTIIEEKICQKSPSTTIHKCRSITSNDHRYMEYRIVEWVQSMKDNYGFSEDQLAIDLTGGTKPMSIGAENAARSLHIPAFYLAVDYDMDTQQPIPGTESLLEMVKRQTQTDENLVFVIMPFKEEFDAVYAVIDDSVKSVKNAELECVRVDKEIYSGIIMDRIRKNLVKAEIIIADLSESNTNVFYELGLAHAWDKKVIMITQDVKKVPFDLKYWRMVPYDSGNIDWLKDQLKKELSALIGA